MPKLTTISIQNHEKETWVRDMRRELARTLSRLNGDRKVTFSFYAILGDRDGKS